MTLKPLPAPPSQTRVLLPSDPPDIEVLQEQLEDARVMVIALGERNDRALALHVQQDGYKSHCRECGLDFPCATVRALNGDDE